MILTKKHCSRAYVLVHGPGYRDPDALSLAVRVLRVRLAHERRLAKEKHTFVMSAYGQVNGFAAQLRQADEEHHRLGERLCRSRREAREAREGEARAILRLALARVDAIAFAEESERQHYLAVRGGYETLIEANRRLARQKAALETELLDLKLFGGRDDAADVTDVTDVTPAPPAASPTLPSPAPVPSDPSEESDPMTASPRKHRVYLAAPLPLVQHARGLAQHLASGGHTVVSTWHTQEATIALEDRLDNEAMRTIGDTCLADIDKATALVLLTGPATDRKGNVGEAFYARAKGIPVLVFPVTADPVLPCKLLFATGFTHTAGIYGLSLGLLLNDTPFGRPSHASVLRGGDWDPRRDA